MIEYIVIGVYYLIALTVADGNAILNALRQS